MGGMVNYSIPEFGVFPLSTSKRKGIKIRYSSATNDCGIIIYDKKCGMELGRYSFQKVTPEGNIYELLLDEYALDKISYLFYEDNKPVIDKNALMFAGSDSFGNIKSYADYRAVSLSQTYDWEEDVFPKLPYHESVGYCLHVRGFTNHKSSKVRGKGTFKGVGEKIPYLKDLGITTIELQPAYEFVESTVSQRETQNDKYTGKLNYWGYKDAFYYVPKRAYSYGKDSSKEFKDMVKELHKNHMELIMQFYFPDTFPRIEILSVLQYWRREYHVDGFHIKGNQLPLRDIVQDPYLCDAKIWHENPGVENLPQTNKYPKRLALYNDAFLCTVRGFLKADKEMLMPTMDYMMRNPAEYGVINYLSNYYGFTMADMVRYQKKHNLANGEENRDGTDYNCTWNCGVEGNTKKQSVLDLRSQQLKNAFALLFLSQGMPLIFMGDEFANSQKGNNNPYCQDNEISWLNWRDLERNSKLHEFVKQLICFRKENKVFSAEKAYTLTDYKSVGFPDLSFHDEEAWRYTGKNVNNHIGFMICGDYVQGCQDTCWYVALNTHWEEHTFALPKQEGKEWEPVFSTNRNIFKQESLVSKEESFARINARCICVFVAK